MSRASSLVLITTAIKPPEGIFGLKMTNVAKRIITTKASVFFWAGLGIKKIVIADATGQILLDDTEVMMLNQMDVEVEQIPYLQDNGLVVRKGKGYGEGALIKFALQNSKFLQSTNNYFKCTGKVYCRNFLEIFNMIQRNNTQNIFWQKALDSSMDTRFFYASKDFSYQFLLPAYENIDDRNKIYAEHCVFKMAQEHLTMRTSLRPMLSGFAGTADKAYFEASYGLLDQNLSCWVSQ